jgi:hypothetical protein
MSEDSSGGAAAAPAVSQEQLQKAEAYVEAEEGVVNRLFGWAGRLVTSIAVAMSLFHLYAAIAGAWPFTDFPIITTQPLRYAHVAISRRAGREDVTLAQGRATLRRDRPSLPNAYLAVAALAP